METNQKVAEVISLFLTSLLPIVTSFTVASLASLSEVVSMEAFDFSGITVPAGSGRGNQNFWVHFVRQWLNPPF